MHRAVDNLTSYFNLTEQAKRVATNALDSYQSEAVKGCTGFVYNKPLSTIEPQFDYFNYRNNCFDDPIELEDPIKRGEVFLESKRIVFSPKNSELFYEHALTILAQLKGTITFEIIVSHLTCEFRIVGTREVLSRVSSAVKSCCNSIQMEDVALDTYPDAEQVLAYSFYPKGPYYRNLAVDRSKFNHVLLSLIEKSSYLKEGQKLLFRVSIKSAYHGWIQNCVNLHQFEERCYRLHDELNNEEEYFLNPAVEGKRAITQKVDPESQPLYYVLPTIITVGGTPPFTLLSSFMQSFRFGDASYRFVEYSKDMALDMANSYSFYTHGHLLNRYESASLFLLPCPQCFERYGDYLLPRPEKNTEPGVILGDNRYKEPVILPYSAIPQSACLIGTQGFGKTNLLLNCLQEIVNSQSPKYSLISFYFHDLFFIQNLISVIPEERLQDTIIARPGMNGMILGRNLTDPGKEDPFKHASALSFAIEQSSITFGVDVKYYVKNGLAILMTLENTSVEDLLLLFDLDEQRGRFLRHSARKKIKHRHIQKFLNKIESDRSETTKIVNKLQDLFDEEQTQKMLGYSGKNILSYEEIVKNQKILLWYLGGLDAAGDALASMEVTAIHKTFQRFSNVEGKIPHFPTLCVIDEAQRIRAGGMEKSIREDRKFGLSYFISTQSLNGLYPELITAINNMKNLGFFQCPDTDAKFFSKSVGGIVTPQDIMFLEKYTLYMRMLTANNVQLVKTRQFKPGDMEKYQFVLQNSLKYCYVPEQSISEAQNAQPNTTLSRQHRQTLDSLF